MLYRYSLLKSVLILFFSFFLKKKKKSLSTKDRGWRKSRSPHFLIFSQARDLDINPSTVTSALRFFPKTIGVKGKQPSTFSFSPLFTVCLIIPFIFSFFFILLLILFSFFSCLVWACAHCWKSSEFPDFDQEIAPLHLNLIFFGKSFGMHDSSSNQLPAMVSSRVKFSGIQFGSVKAFSN